MGLQESTRLAHAPMAGLAMVGVFWGGFAGLMPDIKAIAGASDAEFGLIMMLSAAGAMVSMHFAPRLYLRLGRGCLPLVGLGLAAACLYPVFATDLPRLALAVLLMGACVGLMDICSNIRISAIEAAADRGLMNHCHAMFSFAFGLTALGVGVAREAGHGPAQILPAMALIALALALVTRETAADWQPPEPPPADDDARIDATGRRVVLLSAIVLFTSFIGENSTEAWSALHIERTLGAEVGHGSYGPGILGLVMGFARLFGQTVADRVGERRLVVGSALLGSCGALLIAAAWSPMVVFVGVAVVALGMATIVPSANTMLGRRIPGHARGHALSRAWMFGMTGFFIGPALMGLVAEGFGLRVSYVVMAAIIAASIPAVIGLGRIPHAARRVATAPA